MADMAMSLCLDIMARHPNAVSIVNNAKRIGLGLPIQPSQRFPNHDVDRTLLLAVGFVLDQLSLTEQAKLVAESRIHEAQPTAPAQSGKVAATAALLAGLSLDFSKEGDL